MKPALNLCFLALGILAGGCGSSQVTPGEPTPGPADSAASTTNMSDKVVKTEEEWRKILTPEQYSVLRQKGTERAFTGAYWKTKDKGIYRCAGCGQMLFESDAKYDSGCGWPSFYTPASTNVVSEADDRTHGMARTEVLCSKCGGHLGHVFDDGPQPTGLRYCINSVSIKFEPLPEKAQTSGVEQQTGSK